MQPEVLSYQPVIFRYRFWVLVICIQTTFDNKLFLLFAIVGTMFFCRYNLLVDCVDNVFHNLLVYRISKALCLKYDIGPVAHLDIGKRLDSTSGSANFRRACVVIKFYSNIIRESLNNTENSAASVDILCLAVRHEAIRYINFANHSSSILQSHATNFIRQCTLGLKIQGSPECYAAYSKYSTNASLFPCW